VPSRVAISDTPGNGVAPFDTRPVTTHVAEGRGACASTNVVVLEITANEAAPTRRNTWSR